MESTIEGRNPVLEALRAGRPIGKILLATNISRHGNVAEIIHLAQTVKIPVEHVDRQVIERLSQTGVHQGVLALASVKSFVELDELLTIPQKKLEPAFFLILDGVEDPHNFGAILRTADAVGVHGVIIREKRSVGLTPAVEKASAGAVEYVPVARVVNINQTIEKLKKKGIWITGIDQSAKQNYMTVDFKIATAIVIGGEGAGIPDLVKKNCDFIASIPMKGKIASLNASVAAALVMYEALNQRARA